MPRLPSVRPLVPVVKPEPPVVIPGGPLSSGSASALTHMLEKVNQLLSGIPSSSLVSSTTPATPDTTFPVPHGLDRVPVGYIAVSLSAAAILYSAPDKASTVEVLFLRCDTASVDCAILVF